MVAIESFENNATEFVSSAFCLTKGQIDTTDTSGRIRLFIRLMRG